MEGKCAAIFFQKNFGAKFLTPQNFYEKPLWLDIAAHFPDYGTLLSFFFVFFGVINLQFRFQSIYNDLLLLRQNKNLTNLLL